MTITRLRRALIAAITIIPLTVAAVGTSAAAQTPAPDPSGRPQTSYTTAALPTVQINGVVWDQLVVGDVVYAAGQFTSARPAGAAAGQNETPRANILAYDLNTGELITDFAPSLNGPARSLALSDDGSTLYVGGAFDQVDGQWHSNLAAFDLRAGHGTLISSFAPTFSSTVNTIDVAGDRVYAGGAFTSVNGVDRSELAAVDAVTGQTLDWSASASGRNSQVHALHVSPDGSTVVVGGSFETINGSSDPGYGLVMLRADDASVLPTPVNSSVRTAGEDAAVLDIQVDDTGFYGVSYSQTVRHGNLEGAFKADWDGNLVWVETCHGDSYSIFPTPQEVYVASHAHSCETINGFPQTATRNPDGRRGIVYYQGLAFTNSPDQQVRRQGTDGYADWSGYPSPTLLDWYPSLGLGNFTGMYQAAFDVTGTDNYLLLAGEFTSVNGVPQQGLVRLARRGTTASSPPVGTAETLELTAQQDWSGTVAVSFTPTWDRDNSTLTYSLYRDDEQTPIDTHQVSARHWELPHQTLFDMSPPAGTHTYRLVVTDADGNALEASTTVTQWNANWDLQAPAQGGEEIRVIPPDGQGVPAGDTPPQAPDLQQQPAPDQEPAADGQPDPGQDQQPAADPGNGMQDPAGDQAQDPAQPAEDAQDQAPGPA